MKGTKNAWLFLCIAVVLLVVADPIYGQQKASMGYFIGGLGWLLESGSSSIVYSAGGGGHSITNRWVVGGEGHSSFGPENAGGYGFFNLGYALVVTDVIVVYPLVGLGGGSMTREASPSVSKCALLNPSIEIDWLIPLKGKSGILLGLRGGYTFAVYSDTWYWSMLHVRMVVGGYGFGD